MELIDSEGRLFGRVNVIDAIVVLMVITLIPAGALLTGSVSSDRTVRTTYATVELSPRTPAVAAQVRVGDRLESNILTESFRVTDVYRTPGEDGRPTVTVRVALNTSDRTGLSAGADGHFMTSDFISSGFVTAVGTNGSDLPTSTTNVSTTAVVQPGIATAITSGDQYRVAGQTVGRVRNVTTVPVGADGVRVGLLLSLQTIQESGTPAFGGRPLVQNRRLRFETDRYALRLNVTGVGVSDTGLTVSETPVRMETVVSPERAADISVGDTHSVAGQRIATVDSVAVFPTADPDRRRVQVGATLRTVSVDDQTEYLGQHVTAGSVVRFEADEYAFDGAVVARGQSAPPGTAERVNATVRFEGVSPAVARRVAVGSVEQTRGDVYARVLSRQVESNLTLTIELRTRRLDSGLYFHGQRLRVGRSVSFEFGSASLTGTVQELSADA